MLRRVPPRAPRVRNGERRRRAAQQRVGGRERRAAPPGAPAAAPARRARRRERVGASDVRPSDPRSFSVGPMIPAPDAGDAAEFARRRTPSEAGARDRWDADEIRSPEATRGGGDARPPRHFEALAAGEPSPATEAGGSTFALSPGSAWRRPARAASLPLRRDGASRADRPDADARTRDSAPSEATASPTSPRGSEKDDERERSER